MERLTWTLSRYTIFELSRDSRALLFSPRSWLTACSSPDFGPRSARCCALRPLTPPCPVSSCGCNFMRFLIGRDNNAILWIYFGFVLISMMIETFETWAQVRLSFVANTVLASEQGSCACSGSDFSTSRARGVAVGPIPPLLPLTVNLWMAMDIDDKVKNVHLDI